MSSLIELVDNSRTDKNTRHSYLDTYEKLLISKKYTAKNILEIGIGIGGSIKLWHDYFTNADIYGLDIQYENVYDEIKNKERIILTCTDAYNENVFNTRFLHKTKYDMILDDGPHTLESMKQCIRLYSQVLTDDGIMIIEDVQDWDWIELLYISVPNYLKKYVEIYDLRTNKNRYDDILFVINKNK